MLRAKAFITKHLHREPSLSFGLRLRFEAPLAQRVGKRIKQPVALFPTEAGIRDAQTVDQLLPRHQVLTAGFEVAFDHHTEDSSIAAGDLRRHLTSHLDLFLRIFAAVAMAEVDHDPRWYAGFGQTLGRGIHRRVVVIGLLSAPQDNVAILVAGSRYDCRVAGFGD